MKERTLVIIKPDGVQRGLIGRIVSRFEERGLKIVGMKMIQVTHEQAEQHYAEHREKPFYKGLVEFITASPVVVLVAQGLRAVTLVRHMMGSLRPEDALPGSIRGDFAVSKSYNVIHGSDSPENGKREIELYFKPEELFDYQRTIEEWIKHEL